MERVPKINRTPSTKNESSNGKGRQSSRASSVHVDSLALKEEWDKNQERERKIRLAIELTDKYSKVLEDGKSSQKQAMEKMKSESMANKMRVQRTELEDIKASKKVHPYEASAKKMSEYEARTYRAQQREAVTQREYSRYTYSSVEDERERFNRYTEKAETKETSKPSLWSRFKTFMKDLFASPEDTKKSKTSDLAWETPSKRAEFTDELKRNVGRPAPQIQKEKPEDKYSYKYVRYDRYV